MFSTFIFLSFFSSSFLFDFTHAFLNHQHQNQKLVLNIVPTNKDFITTRRPSLRLFASTTTVVNRFFDAYNSGDLDEILDCFEEDCNYEDMLFENSVSNKEELKIRFQKVLDDDEEEEETTGSPKIVVDKLAYDSATGNIGASWHLEATNTSDDGSTTTASVKILPFSKGCSFYTTNIETGRIQTGFRVMEIPFKPSNAKFNLLTLPNLIKTSFEEQPPAPEADDNNGFDTEKAKQTTTKGPSSSSSSKEDILNQVIQKWNERDMDGAVECFSDDLVLEDTLYSDPIVGKEALRDQYNEVATQVPSECIKIIDDMATDPTNGNIAVRWHLEVENGQNLLEGWSRGCSMYTTDSESGLITSGLDVTEPPLKMTDTGLWSSRHFNF